MKQTKTRIKQKKEQKYKKKKNKKQQAKKNKKKWGGLLPKDTQTHKN